MTNDEMLGLKGLDGISIKGNLGMLLQTLWKEGEGFSVKRPFGDSDWRYTHFYVPLALAGLIDARIDERGYPRDIDTEKGDKIVLELIDHLFWQKADL